MVDKDFKAAIVTMLKEWKKTIHDKWTDGGNSAEK